MNAATRDADQAAPPDEIVDAMERSEDASTKDQPRQLEDAAPEPFPVFIDSPANHAYKPKVAETMIEPTPPTAPNNIKDIVNLQPPVAPREVVTEPVRARIFSLPSSAHNGGIVSAKKSNQHRKVGSQKIQKHNAA